MDEQDTRGAPKEGAEINRHKSEDQGSGYLRRFGLLVVVALALVFLTAAYSMMYDALIGRITPTIAVREGTLERLAPAKAVIVREEKLIFSPVAGTLNIVAKEQSRLAKGEVAARIGGLPEPARNLSYAEESRATLATAELVYNAAKARESEDASFLAAKRAELLIFEQRGDEKNTARLSAEVKEAEASLAESSRSTGKARAEFDRLSAEVAQLPESNGANVDPGGIRIRLDRPALISFEWDGLEAVFSSSNPGLLSIPYKQAASAVKAARKQGDELEKGDVAFREVASMTTDLLLYLEDVDPEIVKPGTSVKLRFPRLSSEKVAAKVRKIKEDDAGNVTAYVSLDRYVNSMTSMRTAEAELLLESFTGLIVPARAVSTGSGRSVVHVLRKDRFVPMEVEVIGIVYGEAVVRSVSLRQGDKVRYDG